jgi:hypothetical protein
LSAVAGTREALCLHAGRLGFDQMVLRDDLSVPEQYALLLPPESPLRRPLDLALLVVAEEAKRSARRDACAEVGL